MCLVCGVLFALGLKSWNLFGGGRLVLDFQVALSKSLIATFAEPHFHFRGLKTHIYRGNILRGHVFCIIQSHLESDLLLQPHNNGTSCRVSRTAQGPHGLGYI